MSEFKGREKKLENMSGPERARHDAKVAELETAALEKKPKERTRASPEELKVKHMKDTAYAVQRMKEWAWKVQDKAESNRYPLNDAQKTAILDECGVIMSGIGNSMKPKEEITKAKTFVLPE